MNKKILVPILIVITLIVGAGIPATNYIGNRSEAEFSEAIVRVNDQFKPIRFTMESYNKGLFSSTAVTKVKMDPKTLGLSEDTTTSTGDDIELTINHTIHHGPFTLGRADGGIIGISSIHSRINMDSVQNEVIQKIFQNKEQPTLNIFVGFGKSIKVNLQWPEYADIVLDDESQMTILEASGNFIVSGDYKNLEGIFNWKGFEIAARKEAAGDRETFKFTDVSITLDQKIENDLLWLGNISGEIALLELITKEGGDTPEFTLKGAGFKSSVGLENNKIQNQTSLFFKNMLTKNKQYGPGNLALAVRNIDKAVYEEFVQMSMKIQASGGQQDFDAELNQMINLLYKLLEKDLIVEITDLNLVTPDGDLKGDASVTTQDFNSALVSGSSEIFSLIMFLKADLNLRAPFALLADKPQYAAQIKGMADAGFVTVEGNSFLVKANFTKGQLFLNNQPLPLFGM